MLPYYPAIKSKATLVTAVPEINQIHVECSPDNEPLIAEPPAHGEAVKYMERLGAAYMTLGDGNHTIKEISESLGATPQQTGVFCGSVMRMLSGDVLYDSKADGANKRGRFVRFGNIALASRLATDEEKQALAARVVEAGSHELLYDIEATRAAEANKIALHAYDHTLVTFRGEAFAMPLDSAETIVATRLMEHLAMSKERRVSVWQTAQSIWRTMPLSERMLFTEDPKTLYSNDQYAPLMESIHDVVDGLFARMRLARRVSAESITIDPAASQLKTSPHSMPPSESARDQVGHILPPGVDKEKRDALIDQPLTPKEISQMDELLEKMQSPDRPRSQVDAIALLDTIMNPRYKREIAQRLDDPTRDEVQHLLSGLHDIARNVLGWSGYAVAYRQRTMGGGFSRIKNPGKGGRVTQVTGNLPTTTKWHIGRPDKSIYKK